MLIIILLIIPLIGLVFICSKLQYENKNINSCTYSSTNVLILESTALRVSILTLLISMLIFTLFHFSSNHFQFVQSSSNVNSFNTDFGIDGSSVYFVLLTTTIIPIALLSNWTSITKNIKSFLSIILLLETLLLSIFLVLDGFIFYVFFESILPPLFILIGLYGSADRVKAGFYLFLYTLLGSLFMLLSILKISSLAGYVQYDAVYKSNFIYNLQLFIFAGIFIAFAVKTPTIFLNNWLLKAHVESPLSGSIILAGIVLKLSLYGIFRLMLPLLAKACIVSTKLVYVIGFITIIYGSASTIRTIDVKELIAYSSVCHAAVYLMGVFSNVVTGIEGGILLGLAHGFVSSGLFICVGGVLYDRSSTRLISVYKGMAQLMPIFSILLFILCLGNCGVPLTLNFIGEFMSLYGIFERHVLFAPLASLSIIFSAAYTIYLFNRIAFAGSYSKYFIVNIPDLNKREFYMLLTLVIFTVIFGIYPAPILDGIHYSTTTLIYSTPSSSSVTLMIFLFRKSHLTSNIWLKFKLYFTLNNVISTLRKVTVTMLALISLRQCYYYLLDIDVLHNLDKPISWTYFIIAPVTSFTINKLITKNSGFNFRNFVVSVITSAIIGFLLALVKHHGSLEYIYCIVLSIPYVNNFSLIIMQIIGNIRNYGAPMLITQCNTTSNNNNVSELKKDMVNNNVLFCEKKVSDLPVELQDMIREHYLNNNDYQNYMHVEFRAEWIINDILKLDKHIELEKIGHHITWAERMVAQDNYDKLTCSLDKLIETRNIYRNLYGHQRGSDIIDRLIGNGWDETCRQIKKCDFYETAEILDKSKKLDSVSGLVKKARGFDKWKK